MSDDPMVEKMSSLRQKLLGASGKQLTEDEDPTENEARTTTSRPAPRFRKLDVGLHSCFTSSCLEEFKQCWSISTKIPRVKIAAMQSYPQ
jgi:hypothetical protein